MMNENANKNDQNSSSDDNDDQGEPTGKECENLVNGLQNNVSLRFWESRGND